jgi:hypothetical protein
MIAMGFIKTWNAMAGMRVLLGILEVSDLASKYSGKTAHIIRPVSSPAVSIF